MDSLRRTLAERGTEATIRPLAHRNPMPRCAKHDDTLLNLIRLAPPRIWLRTHALAV
jgi:hypothetical protein